MVAVGVSSAERVGAVVVTVVLGGWTGLGGKVQTLEEEGEVKGCESGS